MLPLMPGCMRSNERAMEFDSALDLTSGKYQINASLNENGASVNRQYQDTAAISDIQGQEAGGTRRSLIVVYYFHPAARCETCLNIEAYSKEAVESWKKKYDGKAEWKALNIDERENERFVTYYNLQFSSLVLSEQQGGRELKWKNLGEIWNLSNNKEEFIRFVKDELDHFTNNKNQ